MAGINVNHINPFLAASSQVLKTMVNVDTKIGKPMIKDSAFHNDTIVIIIGITGEIKGQVMIAIENYVACDIASKMIMTQVGQLDDLAMSAISELGNMILGNAATMLSNNGITVDITTPTIATGNVRFQGDVPNISVPLVYDDDKIIEINVSIKG